MSRSDRFTWQGGDIEFVSEVVDWLAGNEQQNAVDLLALEIAKRRTRRPDDLEWKITLPAIVWTLILDAVQGKPQKRGHPKDPRSKEIRQRVVVEWAREIKVKMLATAKAEGRDLGKITGPGGVNEQAATKAYDTAHKFWGRSPLSVAGIVDKLSRSGK